MANSSMKTKLLLLVCVLLSSAAAAVSRDEAKASQYIYCENVNLFVVSLEKDDSPEIANFARMLRNHFRLAALLLSDGDFLKSHEEEGLQKVLAQSDKERAGDDGLMIREFQSCKALWTDEVQTLIGWKK
jgi:hypothetical protein